jgi:hypothetical protein
MAAGYLKPEFDVLRADYANRGERFDAAIKAMRAAWTGKPVDFDDPYFEAHGHSMRPTPVQQPGPPIWIGGNSKRARRRAAELGQGWMPIPQSEAVAKITKTPAMPSIEVLATMVEAVSETAFVHANLSGTIIVHKPGRAYSALAPLTRSGKVFLISGMHSENLSALRSGRAVNSGEEP